MTPGAARPLGRAAIDAHAAEISTRGFTVMPGLYPPDRVERLRAVLVEQYEADGRPAVVADGHIVGKGTDNAATAAGYAVPRILKSRPDVAPVLLDESAVAVARGALGDDMRLELAGGLISDRTRPFFKWHNHVGGIEDHRWEGRADYPRPPGPQRILMLVYLEPLNAASGSLLVYPRGVGDPVEAPFAIEREHWPGEIVVDAPAGSAVILEQTTWHAALVQRRDGLRLFFGFYFAASGAPAGQSVDDSLRGFRTDVPLLASVLPPEAR